MTGPNSHFNPHAQPFKTVSAAPPAPSFPKQEIPEAQKAKPVRPSVSKALRTGTIASALYGLQGLWEANYWNNEEGTPELVIPEMLMVVIFIFTPAALMFFQRSWKWAGALSVLALLNALGAAMAWQVGDPYYGLSSVLWNLIFGVVFVRTTLALRKQRAA